MLLEILLAAGILGIAVIGLALLLSRGHEAVVGQGDDRVALHLARQKIEKLIAGGFAALQNGDNVNDAGCPSPPDPNNPLERCYNETILGGEGQQTTGSTALDRQAFTRRTCVRTVDDVNPRLPADTLDPTAWTCPSCTGGTCSGDTRRIKVSVTSRMTQGQSVTLESVFINPIITTSTTTGP